MSILSQIGKHFGIPEINFRKGRGKDAIAAAVVDALISEKGNEVIRKVPDTALAALLKLCKDETRRRLEED